MRAFPLAASINLFDSTLYGANPAIFVLHNIIHRTVQRNSKWGFLDTEISRKQVSSKNLL